MDTPLETYLHPALVVQAVYPILERLRTADEVEIRVCVAGMGCPCGGIDPRELVLAILPGLGRCDDVHSKI